MEEESHHEIGEPSLVRIIFPDTGEKSGKRKNQKLTDGLLRNQLKQYESDAHKFIYYENYNLDRLSDKDCKSARKNFPYLMQREKALKWIWTLAVLIIKNWFSFWNAGEKGLQNWKVF